MTKESFSDKYKVQCSCGETMIVDDIDSYKQKDPIVFLICEKCKCSCRVQNGAIIDWTDKNEEYHKG